jgi:hypothetical protein
MDDDQNNQDQRTDERGKKGNFIRFMVMYESFWVFGLFGAIDLLHQVFKPVRTRNQHIQHKGFQYRKRDHMQDDQSDHHDET